MNSLFSEPYCEQSELLGTDEGYETRDKHDTKRRFMIMDKRYPAPGPGKVDYVEFYAGSPASNRTWSDDRGLKVR